LPLTGCGVHQFSEAAEAETDKKDEPGRDIMLVIAGGEGYVDFRRGRKLTFLTFYIRISVKNFSCVRSAQVKGCKGKGKR